MRNPLWALPLAAPLGVLQLPRAQLLCLFMARAAVLVDPSLSVNISQWTASWYAWTAPAWLFWYLAAVTKVFPRNQGLE
jgi:hypothetical protein